MLNWFRKKTDFVGFIGFPGSLPPKPGEFAFLRDAGFDVARGKSGGPITWSLRLSHPTWGSATLACPAKPLPAPSDLQIEYSPELADDERQEIAAGRVILALSCKGRQAHILRDRKNALRFVRAAMGRDAAFGTDSAAQRIWSRRALDEELAHDADLDISQIFAVHVVSPDGGKRPTWLHTHGLAEIGFFDFDILNPAEELFTISADALRALAFAIVEGSAEPSAASFELARPKGTIRLVEIGQFVRDAASDVAALRCGADDQHNRKRSVACQPAKRWFGRGGPTPSKFLSGPIDDGILINFSHDASELMAERARNTFSVFRRWTKEFAGLEFPPLVKLGYRVDGGGPDDIEHLWFTVQDCGDDSVDATLVNTPVAIDRMKDGDRGRHSLELLTDWTILTPAGSIDPRTSAAAHRVRPHLDELRQRGLASAGGE